MNINKNNIVEYANRYDSQYPKENRLVEKEIKKLLQKQKYLTRKELIKIGHWKSTRPRRHYESEENDDVIVKEVTQFSFNTRSEIAKIKSLLILKGIAWPSASVILHFAFPTKYPIMDFRVVWSLDWQQPSSYDFGFWSRYCNRIGKISRKHNLPIRTVEKALWKYSKEHQRRR